MDLEDFKQIIQEVAREQKLENKMKEVSKDLETLLDNQAEREDFVRLVPTIFEKDYECYARLKTEVIKRLKDAICRENEALEKIAQETKKKALIELNKSFNLVESKFL